MNLNIIKIGGNVIDSPTALNQFLTSFANISGSKILVHGGGKMATELSKTLGIATKMYEGRRITDAETLKVATMVYGGLINKDIVALLQAKGCDAIGFSGADANLLQATKRKPTPIDYGFVGDIDTSGVNVSRLQLFLNAGLTPVFCALTHDKNGYLLNTNADTIASVLAVALAPHFNVTLHYCFEKKGVLRNVEDENSLITSITETTYAELKQQGVIVDGMLPKLDNAFKALHSGVHSVVIGSAALVEDMVAQKPNSGTVLTK